VTRTTIVGHSTDHRILDALRLTLDGAEEAILCSAFVRRAGVHLIEPHLAALGDRARLVATSTFGGPSTGEAFAALADLETRLRIANPSRGTFHPKLYVARSRGAARAMIGSANLTGGLVSNVEAAVLLEGAPDDGPLRDAWRTAEAYWAHEASGLWTPIAAEQSEEQFDRGLLAVIRAEVERNPVFLTISSGRPNRVTDVTPSGIWGGNRGVRREGPTGTAHPRVDVPARVRPPGGARHAHELLPALVGRAEREAILRRVCDLGQAPLGRSDQSPPGGARTTACQRVTSDPGAADNRAPSAHACVSPAIDAAAPSQHAGDRVPLREHERSLGPAPRSTPWFWSVSVATQCAQSATGPRDDAGRASKAGFADLP
jgi:hypothetical protein